MRKVRVSASRYFLLNDTLYKRSFTFPYYNAYPINKQTMFSERYMRECGNHSGGKALANKVIGIIGPRCKRTQTCLSKDVTNVKGLSIS